MRNAASEGPAESNVVLDGAFATDLAVVNAARVSFNQKSDKMDKAEIGLINFLMKNGHGSPFEHGYFRFRIHVPIFVAREWFRHRVGHSYNEWSGRYSQIATDFFSPAEFRTQVGKPGAYTFEPLQGAGHAAQDILDEVYDHASQAYIELLAIGVAKEQARMVLPVATYTNFIWSCNPRSMMHFLSLRTHPDAMKEIRDCALAAEDIFRTHMPVTHSAWVAAGRIAP